MLLYSNTLCANPAIGRVGASGSTVLTHCIYGIWDKAGSVQW